VAQLPSAEVVAMDGIHGQICCGVCLRSFRKRDRGVSLILGKKVKHGQTWSGNRKIEVFYGFLMFCGFLVILRMMGSSQVEVLSFTGDTGDKTRFLSTIPATAAATQHKSRHRPRV